MGFTFRQSNVLPLLAKMLVAQASPPPPLLKGDSILHYHSTDPLCQRTDHIGAAECEPGDPISESSLTKKEGASSLCCEYIMQETMQVRNGP